MAKTFKGKIALDIRDSEQDWDASLPPKAPKGAPNVLLLAWDDIGYGTMSRRPTCAGSPMRDALAGRSVRLSELFPSEEELADALKRARTVRNMNTHHSKADGITVSRGRAKQLSPRLERSRYGDHI